MKMTSPKRHPYGPLQRLCLVSTYIKVLIGKIYLYNKHYYFFEIGVILTTCGSDPEASSALESLQQPSHLSLRVPYGAPSPPTSQQSPEPRMGVVGIQTPIVHSQPGAGEYSLFGNPSSSPRN